MQISKSILWIIWGFVLLNSCKKDGETIIQDETSNLKIQIGYIANNMALEKDSIKFRNSSSNLYSINRLQYFISGIKLKQTNGNIFQSSEVFYVDGFEENTNEINLTGIKSGVYESIEFNIGIDSNFNEHGKISNTNQNINMYWPIEMGGGYHFLKFEGNYLNIENKQKGFALHLGTNSMLIKHQLLPHEFNFTKNETEIIRIQMDLNKWFDGAAIYNFQIDGNYSMGINSLMQKLQTNGKSVFEAK